MAVTSKLGSEFLNRLYRDMYKSDDVMYGINERFIGNKTDNIEHYIERMRRLHERVAKSGRENDLRMLKQFYYRKYVIQEEDIPKSYYDHQKEIYLERGYGHVDFTENDRHQMAMQIITDQQRSLDKWIEYFISQDSDYIPMWAKYWIFQGMLNLGSYNKSKKLFDKRSKGTISPFIDLNAEAVALCIDYLFKSLDGEEIDDKQLETLLKGGSFGKIYTYVLNNVLSKKNNSKKSDEGKWVKYNQGSNHMPLVKSLQGYNTGWCTAGEATARNQLADGDFYIYYSYNENGEAVIPRIAIRMEHGEIAEVRGAAKDQNLEPEMESIVEKKLNEFPDKDEYIKKTNDMKKLSLIYKKNKNGEDLTREEILFLYELSDDIEGFGYIQDPRVNEIRTCRNNIEDLNMAFNGVELWKNDLDLSWLTNAYELQLPKSIGGDLNLNSLTSAQGLNLPQSIGGSLYLNSLTSAQGLHLPQSIEGSLELSRLKKSDGLTFPKSIGGLLNLNSLTSAQGLHLPKHIGKDLLLKSLKNAQGLVFPETINGGLDLNFLTSNVGLHLPKHIGGSLNLKWLYSAKDLQFPKTIGGSLDLSSIDSAKGAQFPELIGGSLDLSYLKTSEGLHLPKSITGDLYLRELTDIQGLVLPEFIGGSLDLSNLSISDVAGLQFPSNFKKIILAESIIITPDNVHEYINGTKKR